MQHNNPYGMQQQLPPFTPTIKKIIIVSSVIWLLGQVILDQYIFKTPFFEYWFGFTPNLAIRKFFIWQPFTYSFLHDLDPWHVIFSMLSLWFVGGELERLWGSRPFLIYYVGSAVGSAFLYGLILLIYGIITGNIQPLSYPVIGSTSAIFAVLLAYGLVFGERTVYFMFLFPMKAKWFVAVLAGIQIVMMLNMGLAGHRIAQLAHILGVVSGYILLWIWTVKRRGGGSGSGKKNRTKAEKSRLRLVVNNNEYSDTGKPKYWN